MGKREIEISPEHHALVRRIATGIARRLPSHVSLDDMVSDGWIGYLDARGKFDPARKILFENYAEFRIKGAILDGLRRADSMPKDARLASKAMARVTGEIATKKGRKPEGEEVAKAMGMTIGEYHDERLRLSSPAVVFLDDLSPYDRERVVSADFAARSEEEQLDVVDALCAAGRLEQALACLGKREEWIIRRHFYDGQTLRQIGDVLGISESRVCQIIGGIIVKLRPIYEAISRAEHMARDSATAGEEVESIDFKALQTDLDAAIATERSFSDSDDPEEES